MLGELAIDYDRRRVTAAGRAADLTPTEYELLRALSLDAGFRPLLQAPPETLHSWKVRQFLEAGMRTVDAAKTIRDLDLRCLVESPTGDPGTIFPDHSEKTLNAGLAKLFPLAVLAGLPTGV